MSDKPEDQAISDLLDLLDSAEKFDDQGRHVVTMGPRSTAHKTRLCRVEVCGREPSRRKP